MRTAAQLSDHQGSHSQLGKKHHPTLTPGCGRRPYDFGFFLVPAPRTLAFFRPYPCSDFSGPSLLNSGRMVRTTGNYQGVDHLALEGVSRLIEGENFEIPYGFLNQSVDRSGSNNYLSLDGSRIVDGSAHEDACVDGCSPLVHYNTSQAMNSRGVPASFQPRIRHSVSNLDYSCLHPQSLHFDMPGSAPRMDYKDTIDPSASEQFQDNGEWGFVFDQPLPAFPEAAFPGRDEDNHSLAASSTTCDSACNLGNRCTGVACADTDDACNDRNCPDLSASISCTIPCEVANAAAALTSIGGAPGPQQLGCPVPTSGKLRF